MSGWRDKAFDRRVIIAIAIVIVVVAGGTWLLLKGGPSTPEGTIRAFFEAFNDRNPDEAYRLFSDNVRAEHPKSEMESYIEIPANYGVRVTDWRVLGENRTDDRTRIKLESTFASKVAKDVENNFVPLVLVDGQWLIDEWVTEWDREAPSFTLTDVDGNTFSLRDHRGKVVIIELMSTRRDQCRAEVSHLKEIHSEYGENVKIVSIDVESGENDEVIREFRDNYGADWVFASSPEVGSEYGWMYSLPKLFVIDTEGVIAYESDGLTSASELSAQIDEII